jgi:hypothetical protein
MKLLSHRNARILGASVGCCAIGFGIAACSSSSSGGSPDGSSGGGGGGPCTNPTLTIAFNPMYSAFISSDSMHKFKVPAIVTGVSGAAVTWSATDPTAADFSADPTTGGTIILVHKSGPITIQAQAGNLCGVAPLNVTQNTDGDWMAGSNRYNNGNTLGNPFGGGGDGGMPMMPPPGGFRFPSPSDPSPFEPADGGPGPACTACHGVTATTNLFRGIEHTPEQTAGFSDQELTDIIVNGIIPDGGYYDPSILPYRFWQFFHKWRDMTPDQVKGIVCYLRSLEPAKQDGHLDFNGIMMRGGGPPPMMEAGPSDEASTTDDAGTVVPEAGPDSSAPTGDATTD